MEQEEKYDSEGDNMEQGRTLRRKLAVFAGCILLIFVCWFPITSAAVSQKSFQSTKAVLEEKKDNVMKMATACAVSATAIAAIPDDITTPIANKIMDMTSYLVVILAAIYLEKFLLVIMGYVSFRGLIPIGLLLFGLYALSERHILKRWAARLILMGVLLFALIPVSVKMSSIIEANCQDTFTAVLNSADVIEEETETETEEEAETETGSEAAEDEEEQGLFGRAKALLDSATDTVKDAADSVVDAVKSTVQEKLEQAEALVNHFIDAIAVLIVTSCLIPLLVLFLFSWIIRTVSGIDVPAVRPGSLKGKVRFKEKKS